MAGRVPQTNFVFIKTQQIMKTVFITGTSGGLGKAAVQLFHSKGWNVIATMRNTAKAKDFEGIAGITILPLDVADARQIEEAVKKAIALQPVDVVINNAAYGLMGPLEAVSAAQLQQQIDTNLLGAIRVTQAFIPHFREKRSGMIVNITSIAGLTTFPLDSLYHTVKWGLEAFSEGLSYELAPFGIGVKTVAPGFIHTDFGSNAVVTSAAPYQAMLDRYLQVAASMMDPATTGSTPADVAAVVYEAVTDGKDQVHYVAGADARAMYQRRLEVGAEASRKEMATVFLGQPAH
jgi:NAD(P)-dependent dehydrogenase (short-subunit alcohol dehydrogenase family)